VNWNKQTEQLNKNFRLGQQLIMC